VVSRRQLKQDSPSIFTVENSFPKTPPPDALKKIKVAILFQRFGPYHHARLNAAGRLFLVWGVEACGMEDIYAWDKVEGSAAFTRVTLTDRDTGDRRWKLELHRKMWRALDDIKPDVVVVPGWSFADALSALLWCAKTNTPSVVMSESTAWDESRVGWKEWIKHRLVKLNSAGLAGATPHTDYLVQLGLESEWIFPGYDVVDNEYFKCNAEVVRGQGTSARRQHGLPDKYFLASARYVEKKNLFRLIKAYRAYRDAAEKAKSEIWDLVLLGDGPLKVELNRLISELGLDAWVHRPGFKQYHELPLYFGLAGAFIHASTTEQWGLVVNEAMASGLPVLVSNRCGCAPDLVAEGVNGFTFAPENVDQLTQLMLKVSAGDFPLAVFGNESRRIISNWGPERFASGLYEAVMVALKNPRPQAGWLDWSLLNALLRR